MRSVAGNPFNSIYEEYRDSLRQFLIGRVDRDDLDDVLQETFTRAFLGLRSFRGGSMKAWLRSIALNHFRNIVRDRMRYRRFKRQYSQHSVGKIFQPQFSSDLVSAIDGLPIKLRLVAQYRFLEEFTHKEISDKLDISVSASKARAFMARKRLSADMLEESTRC